MLEAWSLAKLWVFKFQPLHKTHLFSDLFANISRSHLDPKLKLWEVKEGNKSNIWKKFFKIWRRRFWNNKVQRSHLSTIFFHFQYHSHFTNNMKGLQKSFKMVLDSSLYDLSYHSYVCQSTANIVKISPKLRFLDDHNSKNTRLMWLKFGVAKLLYICIDLTKFKENPGGLSFFLCWFDMEWP